MAVFFPRIQGDYLIHGHIKDLLVPAKLHHHLHHLLVSIVFSFIKIKLKKCLILIAITEHRLLFNWPNLIFNK